jgi:hypothetical protein
MKNVGKSQSVLIMIYPIISTHPYRQLRGAKKGHKGGGGGGVGGHKK